MYKRGIPFALVRLPIGSQQSCGIITGSEPFAQLTQLERDSPVCASGPSRWHPSRSPTATTNRLPSGRRTAPAFTLRQTSSRSRTKARLLNAHTSSLTSLVVASQFDQAIGGGARHVQLAQGNRCLPRVACEHGLDELQSRRALPMVFHALRPPI